MPVFNLVLGVFCLLGPLLGAIVIFIAEWPDVSVVILLSVFVVGVFPALLTGIVCGICYQYTWIKGKSPNILFITIATSISGFVFSYFPFGQGALYLGIIGIFSAFVCSLVSASLYFRYAAGGREKSE